MKKCWDNDPLKRPIVLEIKEIINNWYKNIRIIDFDTELKNDIIDFYKADKTLKQNQDNSLNDIKDHPQVFHTSRLLDFTEKLNEILDHEIKSLEISQNIGNYYNIYII